MEIPFSSVKPGELKCEFKVNPTGIDEKHPRFSWLTECDSYNSYQTAYQLIVASSFQNLLDEKIDIWDSGKIKSSQSNQILFEGTPLISNKTYFWKVRVWNETDESSAWSDQAVFSTGLFEQTDWEAKWISHIYNEQQETDLSFKHGTDKWIWYPIKDPADRFKVIYLHKSFKIDQLSLIESAKLLVTADEKFELFLNEILVAKSDEKIFSWARPVFVDVKEFLSEGLNNIKVKGTNTYVDRPGFILRLEIKLKDGKEISIVSDSSWLASIDLPKEEVIKAEVIAVAGDKPWRLPKLNLNLNPAAYFRKTFITEKRISRAFVYISALGLYNLKVNGKPVSQDLLTPGWSDFNKHVYYIAYEVCDLLKSQSENVINVILADGYYSGYCGWEKGRGYYGKYPALKLQLMIDYEDGKQEVICSDDNWTSSEGPIREADILMGEAYDSNYEYLMHGWESFKSISNFRKVKVRTDIYPKLTSYKAEEVRIKSELKPYAINKIGKQKFIVDFNQNFAGFVRLKLKNPGKRKIELRFAEMLNEDGTLYTENIRMARAQDSYISRGDTVEIWQPMFTYHGFRYVEITGLDEVDYDTVAGISINSLPKQTAYFSSSNEKLNKCFSCILWNQRSNYVDIPTDCPQRDERFGWLGDAVSFFSTAAHNFDVSAFYSKWLENLFDSQKDDGSLPPFAPFVDMGVGPIYFNSAGWADAAIVTPYLFYKFYNDKKLLAKYYEQMKKYIQSIERQTKDYIFPDFGYGDWLYRGNETSKSLIATSYFAYDCHLMNKIASILGYKNDAIYYNDLFKKIKQKFRSTFLDTNGNLLEKTQTAAVLSIHFSLLENGEIEKAKSLLVQNIIDNDYHVTTGFLGLSFLMPVLSSIGRNDIVWKILTNEDFPSWFNMINLGATTLWERWDSYHPERGFFDPTMNSFNHCSLGCVGDWLFKELIGINAIEPGFKKFIIKPFIPERLNFAEASLKTIYGVINSGWAKVGENILLKVTVPFSTQATLVLPSKNYNINFQPINTIKLDSLDYLEVGSGKYEVNFKIS
jgi:alpha-L-rhamnosidase